MFSQSWDTNFTSFFKMVLGSLVICKTTGKARMHPTAVTIKGSLRGFIGDFTVRQDFKQSVSKLAELSYIVPNNMKMCIYDTTFYVGDEIIKPRIEEKQEAQAIYIEATAENRAALLARNIGNGLIEFILGSIPRDVVVSVEVKCCFFGSRSEGDCMLFKFPLDICTPSGGVDCVFTNYRGSFSFEFDCSSRREEILEVTCSEGTYDQVTGKFSLSGKSKLSAVIVSVRFREGMKDEALIGGDFMSVSVFGRELAVGETNSEFVFVVDCSGSMGGERIANAKECLALLIRSIPIGSYFNVYRFGSRFTKLFEDSLQYDDDTFSKALSLAQCLEADLGGTDICPVLQDIFASELHGRGTRQIFVLTDGEVLNTTTACSLAKEHSDKNRIFTLGIGRGADAGLVQGLADATGGLSDFVLDSNVDFSSKVIPQLEASLYVAISDVSLHVEGHDAIEQSDCPLRPMTVNGDTHFLVKSTRPFTESDSVLVTGRYGDHPVEFPIPVCDAFVGDMSFARVLEALFSYRVIERLSGRMKCHSDEEDQLKGEIITLSKSSGVLSSLTSFVGCSNTKYELPPGSGCSVMGPGPGGSWRGPGGWGLGKCGSGRGMGGKGFGKGGSYHAPSVFRAGNQGASSATGGETEVKKFGFTSVTDLQSMRGYWTDIKPLLEHTGDVVPTLPDITNMSGIGDDDKMRALHTVFAIAVLRHYFLTSRSSWKMVEGKAISWLSQLSQTLNWEGLIQQVESTLSTK